MNDIVAEQPNFSTDSDRFLCSVVTKVNTGLIFFFFYKSRVF